MRVGFVGLVVAAAWLLAGCAPGLCGSMGCETYRLGPGGAVTVGPGGGRVVRSRFIQTSPVNTRPPVDQRPVWELYPIHSGWINVLEDTQ